MPQWVKAHRTRKIPRLRWIFLGILVFILLSVWMQSHSHWNEPPSVASELVRQHVDYGRGFGGRWLIPPKWLEFEDHEAFFGFEQLANYFDLRNPRNPAEAAQVALDIAMREKRYIKNTNIPLIVHQTWKNVDSDTWPREVQESVDAWMQMSIEDETSTRRSMTYVLWDDEGIDYFLSRYYNRSLPLFERLPYPVEKTDIFRVAVLQWFGGIYADVDTKPLLHPDLWVKETDTKNWTDSQMDKSLGLFLPPLKSYLAPDDAPIRPDPLPESWADLVPAGYKKVMDINRPNGTGVAAIFGVEGDNPPDKDYYWRMGYAYPVQLTNWAMAMAPQHPIAGGYLRSVAEFIEAHNQSLTNVDPLELTGPPRLTHVVKTHCEWTGLLTGQAFYWDSLSGSNDPPGGRGKVAAGDVLVLPITGFSPGRAELFPYTRSMGSQPVDHPEARLLHEFAGSWQHHSLKVEIGKACRTFLGLCRDWSKFP